MLFILLKVALKHQKSNIFTYTGISSEIWLGIDIAV
jgi:hypothetical protein